MLNKDFLKKRNSIFIGSLFVSFLVFSCQTKSGNEQTAPEVKQWKQPKEIVMRDGNAVAVYDWRGFESIITNVDDDSVYVFNFWATWCRPCIEELPYFEELHAKEKKNKVAVVLVSLDFRNALKTSLLPYIKKNELKAHVISLNEPNANEWIDKVSPNWSGAIPATLIVKGGKREFYEKSFTLEELKDAVEKIKG